jgi:hypothetical protein
VYADEVATGAAIVGVGALGWQISSSWWDRPYLILQDDHVSNETGHVYSTHTTIETRWWSAEVTVSNTGNAETTVLGVQWEFAYESADLPTTFVAGSVMGDELEITHLDFREAGQGLSRILQDESGEGSHREFSAETTSSDLCFV